MEGKDCCSKSKSCVRRSGSATKRPYDTDMSSNVTDHPADPLQKDRISTIKYSSAPACRRNSKSTTGGNSHAQTSGGPRLNQLLAATSQDDGATKNRARRDNPRQEHQSLASMEQCIAAETKCRSIASTDLPSNGSFRRQKIKSLESNIEDNNKKTGFNNLVRSSSSYRSKESNALLDYTSSHDHNLKSISDGFAVPSFPGGRQKDRGEVAALPEATATKKGAARGLVNKSDVEHGTHGYAGDGTDDIDPAFDKTLAVAVAVSEESEIAFIPAAVEYDDASKPGKNRNRRFRFCAIAATVLMIVIGVGVALGVVFGTRDSRGSNSMPTSPTSSPTTLRESLGITDKLVALVGKANLADPDSPHSRAAKWIINDDPRMLEPDAENFIQRFLLTLFYVSTTEITPWLSCNPPIGKEIYLCNFTKLIQTSPEMIYEYVTWGRWLSSEHECGWAGVFCDELNQVRAVELPGQQINGTFPPEIALIPLLQSLAFQWNELHGTIPSELAPMKRLLSIELHHNFFTGQVPANWHDAQALQRVNVAGNFLTGTIPTEIGQMTSLRGLFSADNSIAGTIPTEIGNMKLLSITRWYGNFLTGTMPSEVGNLKKVQDMGFFRNRLTGELPSEMGNMRGMVDLRLHYNQFSGSIPEEHYKMQQLRRWDLYDCNITGTISTSIGLLNNLQIYRIHENNFHGTLPTELGKLSRLNELWLHQNDLIGSVPNELCALRGPAGVTILDADCGSTNKVGGPLLECPLDCCTVCCDAATEHCF